MCFLCNICVIARRIECISIVRYTSSVWVPTVAKLRKMAEKSEFVNDHVVGFAQNELFAIYMCCGTPHIVPILRMRGGLHFRVELGGKSFFGLKCHVRNS